MDHQEDFWLNFHLKDWLLVAILEHLKVRFVLFLLRKDWIVFLVLTQMGLSWVNWIFVFSVTLLQPFSIFPFPLRSFFFIAPQLVFVFQPLADASWLPHIRFFTFLPVHTRVSVVFHFIVFVWFIFILSIFLPIVVEVFDWRFLEVLIVIVIGLLEVVIVIWFDVGFIFLFTLVNVFWLFLLLQVSFFRELTVRVFLLMKVLWLSILLASLIVPFPFEAFRPYSF